MSKNNTVTFETNGKNYAIHPQVKKYGLKDFGFVESSPGKYRFERHLGQRADTNAPMLKLAISHELSRLKISTTSANGLKKIKLSQTDHIEYADSLLSEMVEEEILIEK
ncbi:MAG: cysteine desulfurase [Atopococcus tabaci]|uniref:Cysteine desulfurase n=1 Tax=Atopococcus tabaci TaxID=269774 RepID=A0AA43ZT10_9LACT|nr:cysteine desulfurase [Atopococcus tabaci]